MYSGYRVYIYDNRFFPVIGAFLRGKTVVKIANGQLQKHNISTPVESIKSARTGKYPNPFKLFIFDYLIVKDVYNKRHYLNL